MISILFPTVRPQLFERAWASIDAACGSVPYEVVVVTDFEPKALPHTRWIIRERLGPVDAVGAAFEVSKGEYVFVFNDESILEPNSLKLLHDAAVREPSVIFSPRHVPGYTFTYFDRPFAPFPFMHRSLAKSLGGLFDLRYRAFYADPDLGMRADAAKVLIRVIEDAVITHHNGQDDAKVYNMCRYMSQDQAIFRARWGHLGEFRDC